MMIDEFSLIRVIETGFTATIYEAELQGRLYALKKYKTDKVKYAKQEFVLANMLNHNNIIRYLNLRESAVHKGDAHETCCVIVIEYASGGELTHLIQKVGTMHQEMARTFFHMLIAAIEHMHSKGVYHLDIKLDNILLNGFYELKLADFGFSSVNQINSIMGGSQVYAAPEIMTLNHYSSELADVFACGVVLFALLFKELPFASSNLNDQRRVLLTRSPSEFWSKLPEKSTELKDFLSIMLQENSYKRATLQQVKNHPWFKGDVMMGYDMVEELNKKLEHYRNTVAKAD